jgi:membrane-bound serine protease (ClpP class)
MIELFYTLLIAGLMLIGAEVFIPGGVLGLIGGLALFGAVIIAFNIYSATTATFISVGIIMLVGVVIALWIKVFPKTGIGRTMTVSKDLHDAKGTENNLDKLLGMEGITVSPLHPAGYAEIDGRRIDVVTQGDMIERNAKNKYVEIEGHRVLVAELNQ